MSRPGDGAYQMTGLERALDRAASSERACLVEAMLDPEDISPTLRRLTEHVSHKVRAATAP